MVARKPASSGPGDARVSGVVDPIVEPLDVSADLLTASFAAEVRASVAHIDGWVGATPVRLAVLSASHQVVVGPVGAPTLVETVACDAGGSPLDLAAPPDGVEFSSRRLELDAAGAALLRERAEAAAGSGADLVVAFPGGPAALTWLTLEPDGWRTLHGYPSRSGAVVVETRTRLGRLEGGRS